MTNRPVQFPVSALLGALACAGLTVMGTGIRTASAQSCGAAPASPLAAALDLHGSGLKDVLAHVLRAGRRGRRA